MRVQTSAGNIIGKSSLTTKECTNNFSTLRLSFLHISPLYYSADNMAKLTGSVLRVMNSCGIFNGSWGERDSASLRKGEESEDDDWCAELHLGD